VFKNGIGLFSIFGIILYLYKSYKPKTHKEIDIKTHSDKHKILRELGFSLDSHEKKAKKCGRQAYFS
jgi:hypothetical protein